MTPRAALRSSSTNPDDDPPCATPAISPTGTAPSAGLPASLGVEPDAPEPRHSPAAEGATLRSAIDSPDLESPKRYLPDFIVQVGDGHGADNPLNIVVETKGYRGLDAQLKAETMATHWVPGVNNLGTFGRWAFAEFRDVYEIEQAFAKLVEEAVES